jgi:hypothetical protein
MRSLWEAFGADKSHRGWAGGQEKASASNFILQVIKIIKWDCEEKRADVQC